MKKLIVLSMCAAMGLASITGCGSKPESSSATESSSITEASSNADEYSKTKTVDWGEMIKKTATVNEAVIYDENDVIITVTGMDYLNNAVEVKFKVDNNSDKNLSFIAGALGYSANAVDNYMTTDGYMNCDVSAGESEEDFIDIAYSELVMHGIEELSEIQVGFRISDGDISNDFITGPLQIKTSAYDESKYKDNAWVDSMNNSDYADAYGFKVLYSDKKEVYNSNGVSVISEMYAVNKNDERMVILEEKNDSENTVYVQTSEICVNGIMVHESTWNSDTITPHKNMVSNISIDDLASVDELNELGISEIENVSFKIRAIDQDWNEVADPSYVKIDIKNGDSVSMESQDAIVKEIPKSEPEESSSVVSELK